MRAIWLFRWVYSTFMKTVFNNLFALTVHYTYAFGRCCSIKVHSRYSFFQYHDVDVAMMLCLSQKEFIFHNKMPQTSVVNIFSRAKSPTVITGFSSVDNNLFNHTFLHKHETDTSASSRLKHLYLLHHCLYQKKNEKAVERLKVEK